VWQIVATLALDLRPRQGLARVQAKSHISCSWEVGECEGMNPHTPKWALTLGVGIPMDSWTFIEGLQRSKPIGLRSSLYH